MEVLFIINLIWSTIISIKIYFTETSLAMVFNQVGPYSKNTVTKRMTASVRAFRFIPAFKIP